MGAPEGKGLGDVRLPIQLVNVGTRFKFTGECPNSYKSRLYGDLGARHADHDAVCGRLGLADRTDKTSEAVAKTIIELAQRGVRDTEMLRTMTLQEFNVIE